MIISQNELQFIMSFNKEVILLLNTLDYENMTKEQKNELIAVIADKEGLLFNEITPDFILQYHRDLKREEMNQKCDDIISAGFTATNGNVYRTNRDDQINMIGQKDELNYDEFSSYVDWKTEDKGYIRHTREEWLTVYAEAFAFKKQQLFKYDSLKKAIFEAQTHPEIIAIKWV